MDTTFNHGSSFTRSCVKSNSYSLLDYIFISRSLQERVSDCSILYDGENPSDHNPVQINLEVVPQHPGDGGQATGNNPGKVKWSARKDDDLSNYESAMSEMLDTIQVAYET